MDVVCNIPTGNLNFLDMKIIKIKKKIKIFRTDGEFTHLTRSASLVDNNAYTIVIYIIVLFQMD